MSALSKGKHVGSFLFAFEVQVTDVWACRPEFHFELEFGQEAPEHRGLMWEAVFVKLQCFDLSFKVLI